MKYKISGLKTERIDITVNEFDINNIILENPQIVSTRDVKSLLLLKYERAKNKLGKFCTNEHGTLGWYRIDRMYNHNDDRDVYTPIDKLTEEDKTFYDHVETICGEINV